MAIFRYATDLLQLACSRPGCGHGFILDHGIGLTECTQAPPLHCETWLPPYDQDERIGHLDTWN